MTKNQLLFYLQTGREIEFNYSGKRYSITYGEFGGKDVISFCEFNKEPINVETEEELCKIEYKGVKLLDMLSSISEDEIDIF